ncbi:MarR family transcriptional regulator [Streptomyces sp. NBC_00378]|uniref:MarR family winged helix-turn-helix transcriptional regulator n=1 Tax=unclassified Streptomyces TaxID=2593676 RepID=UPI00225A6031|nr:MULTISPECIES: MarR family transcriptional regulator [unclassified Streptomyces]MCX5114037.1 MarR family transcriptional regulator [Streptomyces sp. NBC_00378]
MKAGPAGSAGPPDPACPGPPSAALGGPVSHALSRVARLHRTAAGRLLKGLGLYPGQEFLMMYLWDAGAVRQAELIKAVDLDPSTVTKMLQRLEQSGHVCRRPDPDDRRAVLVEATDESCALHSDVQRAWVELEDRTLAGLEPAEREELTRLLAKVEANLCREAGEAGECGEAGGCPGPR